LDGGAEQMRLAREYDPLSPATNRAYCSVLIMQRKFPEAVAQCERTIAIFLDTPNSRIALARAYFYVGRYAEAFEQLEIQMKSNREDEAVSARSESAYYYAKLERKPEAEKIYADLKRGLKKDPSRAFDLALIAFELGKKDEALIYFKQMLGFFDEMPDAHLSLAYDPYWDDIKKDSQFASLIPNLRSEF
jgi:tetratricopeptide (TPR) repeat protein